MSAYADILIFDANTIADRATYEQPQQISAGIRDVFINGVAAEPRFSELLYETSTDRLLAAPLYSRGKLVGFIDMRDKAGKAPFDQTDIAKAQDIAERIIALFANMNVFGQRFIPLSKISGAHPAAEDDRQVERPVVSDKPPVRDLPAVLSVEVQTV